MENVQIVLISSNESIRSQISDHICTSTELIVHKFSKYKLALKKLDKISPHCIVILDISNNLGEEINILKQINNKYRFIPVIVIKDESSIIEDYANLIVYSVFTKPIDLIKLICDIKYISKQNYLLRQFATTVRDIFKADMCIVWRMNKGKRRLEIASWDGNSRIREEFRESCDLSIDDPSNRKTFKSWEPQYYTDLEDYKSPTNNIHRELANKYGWKSLLSAPLVQGERI